MTLAPEPAATAANDGHNDALEASGDDDAVMDDAFEKKVSSSNRSSDFSAANGCHGLAANDGECEMNKDNTTTEYLPGVVTLQGHNSGNYEEHIPQVMPRRLDMSMEDTHIHKQTWSERLPKNVQTGCRWRSFSGRKAQHSSTPFDHISMGPAGAIHGDRV